MSPRKVALGTVIAFLKAVEPRKDLVMTKPESFDEDTDPNKLLGRPGQYLAKVNWTIDGKDATIEVYDDLDAAKARAEYVGNIGKSTPMFLQYIYVNEGRKAVLRLPHELSPKDAKLWEETFAKL